MKILESYKKIAKSMLIEHAWDRKFGEPLPTLKDVMGEQEKHKEGDVWKSEKTGKWQAIGPSGDQESFGDDKEAAEKHANPEGDKGDKEEPKGKGLGKGDFERDGGEPEDKPFGGDTGKDADSGQEPKSEPSGEPEDGEEEPSSEPEGGEQNIPSDDEIDSYQEKLNTYTGPYSDGNEIHTKWEGITTKVWAETSEEAYKDEPDHPLNKPSDSEWADTVGEEVRALATAHFSEFGDELKDASPEAKAYFKEKGLPPSGDKPEESITITGKQYRPIKDSVEPKKHLLRETYERIGGK